MATRAATGTVMAVHLFHLPASTASVSPSSPSVSSTSTPEPVTPASLHLLIAYESGQLALFRFTPIRSFERTSSKNGDAAWVPREGTMVEESEGWELVWVEKGHRDAGAWRRLSFRPSSARADRYDSLGCCIHVQSCRSPYRGTCASPIPSVQTTSSPNTASLTWSVARLNCQCFHG